MAKEKTTDLHNRILSLVLSIFVIGPLIGAFSLTIFTGSFDDGFTEAGFLFGAFGGFICGLIMQIGNPKTVMRRLALVSCVVGITCFLGSFLLGPVMIVIGISIALATNIALVVCSRQKEPTPPCTPTT